jgi:CoA:oxalate CoA-transferase
MVLADLGARVIKVEAPGRGDDARHIGPFVGGKSAYFMSLNRGKQSIALNLDDQRDRTTFEALLGRGDVLIENYRPGTMEERFHYPWEELHARYPRLIYAAASGFGQTGPYRKRPAYDMVVQAMGGIMSLTGHPGGPPTRVGSSIGDIAAGIFTAIGINAALYHRASTGEALFIDVAMLDTQVAILENAITRYFATGEIPGPIGSRHPSIAPFDVFSTASGYIVICAGNDDLFSALCTTLGRPDLLAEEPFMTNEGRTENHALLKIEIEKTLRGHDSSYWLAKLEAAGIPSGPLSNIEDVLRDPQVAARNMIVSSNIEGIGKLNMAGNPIKMPAFADSAVREPAPDLDGDRAAILAELAST